MPVWTVIAASLIVGMGGRAALLPWLGNEGPFILAFPVVALVALAVGTGPAIFTAALCALWAWAPWIPVQSTALSAAVFMVSACVVAVVVAWVRPAAGIFSRVSQAMGAVSGSNAHRQVLTTTRWIVLVAMAAPTLLYLGVAVYQYDRAFDDSRVRLDRSARIAAEHASKVFETNEMLLHRVFDAIGTDSDVRIAQRELALHLALRKMVADLPQVQSVWVWNAQGRPLLSSRFYPAPPDLDISDREFFGWHRDNRGGLFLTEALVARATGDVFSDLTLRREGPDGTFGGVVSVGLHANYFARFYAELAKDEPGMVVSLLRSDGRWIARHPRLPALGTELVASGPVAQALARSEEHGFLDAPDASDGMHRVSAFRKVGNYPIYVTAGIERAGIVARWQREVGLLGAFAFPAALGLIVLAWTAMRRAQQGLAAVEQLQAESASRQRAEQALRQAQKLEAMGRLTGGVAHDFNNLLAVVNNNLFLHRRLHTDLADNAQLAAIERAVQGGTQLTRQLLAFSRRQPAVPEVMSLQERLPMLLELARPLLTADIVASTQVAPETATVRVDRAELELALINLVVNARDAMPGGGSLKLTARNAAASEVPELGGDFVAIEVTDTGDGIAPEVLEHVFEPFFTTKPAASGTGLGLSQVYGLCVGAGGTARISSQVGAGTTVRMFLPAVRGRAAAIADPGVIAPRQLAFRLLLVEDNDQVAEATQQLLEALGCTVSRLASADDAVDYLQLNPCAVDAVLSDVSMPGARDGIALGRWIRCEYPAIGVVLTTGYAERLDRAVEAGLPVLPKPCSPVTLADALQRAVVDARAHRSEFPKAGSLKTR